jgi:hypothetical protein
MLYLKFSCTLSTSIYDRSYIGNLISSVKISFDRSQLSGHECYNRSINKVCRLKIWIWSTLHFPHYYFISMSFVMIFVSKSSLYLKISSDLITLCSSNFKGVPFWSLTYDLAIILYIMHWLYDLLLKSAFERIFNVMQLILVKIEWYIKWKYWIQKFHDIFLTYYFKYQNSINQSINDCIKHTCIQSL